MIIGKEKGKKGNEKAITNKDLQDLLKKYPDDALILFQDFNFSSSKKQVVKDVIIRKECYPNYKNTNGLSIILINEFLNFK